MRDDDVDELAPADELSELLGGLTDTGDYVRVYRLNAAGRQDYLDRLFPQEADDVLETVRDQWGGGEYRLQPCKNGRVKGKSVRVAIDGPPKAKDADAGPASSTRVEHSPHVEAPPSSILASIERLERLYAELRTPPAPAHGADPLAMAVNIVQAFQQATAPLLAALLERREPVERPDTSREILKAFTAGLQAAANLERPHGGGRSHWDRLIDEVAVPLISKVNEAQEQPRALTPGQVPPRPAEIPPGEPWYDTVARYLPNLQKLAQEGKSAPIIGRALVNELPDDALDELLAEVSAGEPFWADFFTRFPDAQRHEAWYRSLVGQLWHEAYQAEPEDDDQEEEIG